MKWVGLRENDWTKVIQLASMSKVRDYSQQIITFVTFLDLISFSFEKIYLINFLNTYTSSQTLFFKKTFLTNLLEKYILK